MHRLRLLCGWALVLLFLFAVVAPSDPARSAGADASTFANEAAALVDDGDTLPSSDPMAGTRTVTVRSAGRDVQTTVLEQEVAPDGRLMRAGSILVKFRPSTDRAQRDASYQDVGALDVQSLAVNGIVRVQVQPGTAAAALQAYGQRPDVLWVQPDYIRRPTFTPNDPRFGEQYGLTKISAPAAWDRTRSSAAVRIAILDCGISDHPDVRPKVVAEKNFTAAPTAGDICNHGTHVGGIAAAVTNNAVGIAGVGFDASLMNAKVLGDDGSGSDALVIQGIIWATDNGAKVINMSLGGEAGPCSQAEQDGVNYAFTRGVVLVAAAGNAGASGAESPGNCTNVLAVAATDANDQKATFSNFGPNVSLAAPGDLILSANNQNNYEQQSGTSQAGPHVAGLAALVWSTEYGTSNQAVVNRITSTADRITGTGTLWTFGRINAASAVAPSGNGTPTTTPTVTPTVTPTPNLTPTVTPTPTQVSCSPRPRVRIQATAAGPGLLQVTVTAGAGTIQRIDFAATTNAVVNVPNGQPRPGGFSITPGQTQTTFTVQRSAPGAATAPFTVVDGCGNWPTFVGLGVNVP
jgi:thermitase